MRILANYGCKKGSESYSVTLELMGDASKNNIEGTTDELFGLARSAIKRQIEGGAKKEESPQIKDPDLPATREQKGSIIKLAKEKGKFIKNLNSLTIGEANQVIEDLKKAPTKQEVHA